MYSDLIVTSCDPQCLNFCLIYCSVIRPLVKSHSRNRAHDVLFGHIRLLNCIIPLQDRCVLLAPFFMRSHVLRIDQRALLRCRCAQSLKLTSVNWRRRRHTKTAVSNAVALSLRTGLILVVPDNVFLRLRNRHVGFGLRLWPLGDLLCSFCVGIIACTLSLVLLYSSERVARERYNGGSDEIVVSGRSCLHEKVVGAASDSASPPLVVTLISLICFSMAAISPKVSDADASVNCRFFN